MSARPDTWENPDPERYEFVAEVCDQDRCVTPARGTGRCRAGAGGGGRACGKPAVASILRTHYHQSGRRDVPWDYCADHLYGRWVEDGKVMGWRLVPIEEARP